MQNHQHEETIELLKNITVEYHEKSGLIPSLVFPKLFKHCRTLHEVLTLTEEEMNNYDGFGIKKIDLIKKLQKDLAEHPEKFVGYQNPEADNRALPGSEEHPVDKQDGTYAAQVQEEVREELKKIIPSKLDGSGLFPNNIYRNLCTFCQTLDDVLYLKEDRLNLAREKAAAMIQLRDDIIRNPLPFIEYDQLHNRTVIISPNLDENASCGRVIDQTMMKVLDVKLRKGDSGIVKAVQMYLGYGYPQPKSRSEIGQEIEVGRERVRQILTTGSGIFELLSGKMYRNLVVPPLIVEKIQSCVGELYNNHFAHNLENEGWHPDKVDHFADLLFKDIVRINNKGFLVNTGGVEAFRVAYNKMIGLLKDSVFPVSWQTLCMDKKLFDAFLKVGEYQIYEYSDEQYCIAWQHLSSIDRKCKRILWETKKAMGKTELLSEYNQRAMQAGMDNVVDTEDLNITKDKQFRGQPNGIWEFGTEDRLDVREFIENYIKEQDGKIFLKSVKVAVKEAGYSYPDSTIRTYVADKCSRALGNEDLYIHKDYLDVYNDVEVAREMQYGVRNWIVNNGVAILKVNNNQLPKKQLIALLLEKSKTDGIRITNQYLNDGIDYFQENGIEIWISRKEGNEEIIYLNDYKLEEFDLKKLGLRPERKYKRTIIASVINHLKAQNDFRASVNELSKLFIDLVPKDIKKNIFFKIIREKDYFIDNKDGYIALATALLPKPQLLEDIQESVSTNATASMEGNVLQEVIYYTGDFFDWTKLRSKLIKEMLQYPFNPVEIESHLDSWYNKMMQDPESRFQNLFRSISIVYLQKTDVYDRDICLLQLSIAYEPFLKLYLKQTRKTKGMFEVIESIEPIKLLVNYKNVCRSLPKHEINKTKERFSYYLDSLKHFRNNYAHDFSNSELDIGMFKQVETISNLIGLYVYTSMLLENQVF